MNWFDLIMAVLLLLGSVDGARHGLVNKVFELIGLIVGLVVAAWCHDAMAAFLDRTFNLGARFTAYLATAIPARVPLPQPGQPLYGIVTALVPGQGAVTVSTIATALVQVLGFLAVLTVVGVAFALVRWPLAHLLAGVMGGAANRLLGFLFGGLVSVAQLAILVGLATPLFATLWLRGLGAAISSSWSGGHLLAIANWILGLLLPLFPAGLG